MELLQIIIFVGTYVCVRLCLLSFCFVLLFLCSVGLLTWLTLVSFIFFFFFCVFVMWQKQLPRKSVIQLAPPFLFSKFLMLHMHCARYSWRDAQLCLSIEGKKRWRERRKSEKRKRRKKNKKIKEKTRKRQIKSEIIIARTKKLYILIRKVKTPPPGVCEIMTKEWKKIRETKRAKTTTAIPVHTTIYDDDAADGDYKCLAKW